MRLALSLFFILLLTRCLCVARLSLSYRPAHAVGRQLRLARVVPEGRRRQRARSARACGQDTHTYTHIHTQCGQDAHTYTHKRVCCMQPRQTHIHAHAATRTAARRERLSHHPLFALSLLTPPRVDSLPMRVLVFVCCTHTQVASAVTNGKFSILPIDFDYHLAPGQVRVERERVRESERARAKERESGAAPALLLPTLTRPLLTAPLPSLSSTPHRSTRPTSLPYAASRSSPGPPTPRPAPPSSSSTWGRTTKRYALALLCKLGL